MPNYSVDILNNIRLNASQEYAARIPEATQENISTIGQYLQTYTPLYNEFCDNLLNKIGKTIIIQKMFKNPLSRFKAGQVSPLDIEEIFIGMAQAEGTFDPTGPNPIGRRAAVPVDVVYHRQNRQDYYAISISNLDFARVFRSAATLEVFIKGQINAVYSADEYDEYLAMKNVLATFPNKGKTGVGYFDYEVTDMSKATSKEQFAKDFVKTLRKAVNDVKFPSTKYNAAGVFTSSNPADMVLLVHKDISTEVDVELLAKAFHVSSTDMKVVPTIIEMDDFGSLTDTYALLVDGDWFRIFDTLLEMRKQENAQGLFTNYFLHHHQILSASPFRTAVRLKRVA